MIKSYIKVLYIYINFFTQICNTTLSRCTNYSRAIPNLDNTQSCLFTFVYCRTGKMSEILINGCTKYMQTKETKKYKIAEGENLNITYFNFRIGSLKRQQ